MKYLLEELQIALNDITYNLESEIIPFWLDNGIDHEYGGYLTCFDDQGHPTYDTDKYIVTQSRMIWGLSAMSRLFPDNKRLIDEARSGVDFFIKHFWDYTHGGWYWQVKRDGSTIDNGKVVYGQSFAIYALAEYTLASGDLIGLNYAEKTFDLLQKYCSDNYNGGYYENLEYNWTISGSGFSAGDRKSLDIHMHLMEAFTKLVECSNKEIHKRKLKEVIDIILQKMISKQSGCGLNQFTISFTPIPPISIRRTWNAERIVGEFVESSIDTTSYGHNVELAWLLNRASKILGNPTNYHNHTIQMLVDHSLNYGFDYEFGGVFRDGPHQGKAIVSDKEWWQNAEVLVGYLDAYESLGDVKYLKAFLHTWHFINKYMINHKVGEWRQLLSREGAILVGDIGNPWKCIYHTGRSMMECSQRLMKIIEEFEHLANA